MMVCPLWLSSVPIMWSMEKLPARRLKPKAWLLEGPPSYHQQYFERYQQLFRNLRWLIIISVLANTAPISLLPGCNNGFYRFLHFCWMILWYGCFAFASYWEFMHVTIQRASLDRYLNAIESGVYIIHIFVIMLFTWHWRHWIPKVFKEFIKSDLERGYNIDRKRSRRFVGLQLLLVGIFICLAFICAFWSKNFVIYKAFLSIVCYVMPNIISSLSFIQYYLLLQGIAWRQRKVTENLERELIDLIHPRRSEIQKFRLHHAELTHFTWLVNRAFQWSIVLLFVGCFLNFNLVLFLVYQRVESPVADDWANMLYMLLWLAMHLGKVCSILYFNQKVQNEQSKCLGIVNAVSFKECDLQETINHLALQLQTDARQHVVGGLMVLDLKFLTALLVASADFFIFLLQYDVTYEALSKSAQGNVTKN